MANPARTCILSINVAEEGQEVAYNPDDVECVMCNDLTREPAYIELCGSYGILCDECKRTGRKEPCGRNYTILAWVASEPGPTSICFKDGSVKRAWDVKVIYEQKTDQA